MCIVNTARSLDRRQTEIIIKVKAVKWEARLFSLYDIIIVIVVVMYLPFPFYLHR